VRWSAEIAVAAAIAVDVLIAVAVDAAVSIVAAAGSQRWRPGHQGASAAIVATAAAAPVRN